MRNSNLATELQLSKPLPSLETEVFLNFMRTHEVLASELEQFLKPYGLTMKLYNVLRIIRGAGTSGIPSSAIAPRMIARVPDVTRLVDRLVKAGLVERERTSKDRRLVLVGLTAEGEELLASLDEPIFELHQKQFSHVSQEHLKRLSQLLELVRSS